MNKEKKKGKATKLKINVKYRSKKRTKEIKQATIKAKKGEYRQRD